MGHPFSYFNSSKLDSTRVVKQADQPSIGLFMFIQIFKRAKIFVQVLFVYLMNKLEQDSNKPEPSIT